jgi:hypothetical protein
MGACRGIIVTLIIKMGIFMDQLQRASFAA